MDASKLFRSLNILSIDVTIGAVCCSFFFGNYFGDALGLIPALVLASTVWIIYTADHLRDASKIKGSALTERHAFHQNHFRNILMVFAAVLVLNGFLIFRLPFRIIVSGSLLSILVVIYFFVSEEFASAKEYLAALLYTLGILVPVFNGGVITIDALFLILQFYSVALMNLLLFSWFDYEKDITHKSYSFVSSFGKAATEKLVWGIFLLNGVFVLWSTFTFHFLLLWIVAFGHIMILLNHRSFYSRDVFRLIGDALFILPVLSFLVK